MKNEFTLAFNEVLEEKGLPQEVILTALENAMASAYRKAVNASTAQEVQAQVDLETGKVTISAEKEVVEDVLEDLTEVTLEKDGEVADARDLLAILALDCPQGTRLVLKATGPQAREAAMTIAALFARKFGET